MPSQPAILVLETDDALQGLLKTLLRRDGYDPLFVREGKAAVRLVTSREFAAFIIDVSLGPSTLERGSRRGLGFLHYLQQQRPALLPRVIVVTGLAMRELPRDLHSLARVLRKPFDLGEFRTALAKCAGHGSLSVSAVP